MQCVYGFSRSVLEIQCKVEHACNLNNHNIYVWLSRVGNMSILPMVVYSFAILLFQ